LNFLYAISLVFLGSAGVATYAQVLSSVCVTLDFSLLDEVTEKRRKEIHLVTRFLVTFVKK
jgi:hypothetical protein